MSKWECCVCGNDEPCILDMVNDKDGFRPVSCPVDNTSGIKPDWHPVDEPVTDCNKLPKLTTEVFDRPDCPEWCKPGEWVYLSNAKYYKIEKVDSYGIILANGIVIKTDDIHAEAVSARLRPWRGSESLNKVVISGGDTFGVVIGCTWSTANVSGQWINCKKLLDDDYKQPDDSPCGVLEHIENGEWVK